MNNRKEVITFGMVQNSFLFIGGLSRLSLFRLVAQVNSDLNDAKMCKKMTFKISTLKKCQLIRTNASFPQYDFVPFRQGNLRGRQVW